MAGLISYMVAGGIFNATGEFAEGSAIEVKGIITLLTLLSSAAIMALCGLVLKITKKSWIESYALPTTILGSLALAYLFITIF